MMMRSQTDHNFRFRLEKLVKQILGIILSALLVLPTPVCLAQDSSSRDSSTEPVVTESELTPPSFDANSIPSEKVNQFVQAYLQVLELINRRQGELLSAETKIASDRLEREIESQALQLIKQTGLTQQEYLQLLSLANIDPEFGERIAASVQEARNFLDKNS
jgi:hypothetical protein